MENLKQQIKGKDVANLTWKMLLSPTIEDWVTNSELLRDTSKGEQAYKFIQDIGFAKVSEIHSKVMRFGITTTNNIESVNSALLQFRELRVLDLLCSLERYTLEKLEKDRLLVENHPDFVTPYLSKIFSNYSVSAPKWVISAVGPTSFFISFQKQNYNVQLYPSIFCSCNVMKSYGYPCLHVGIVLMKNNLRLDDFCLEIWKKPYYIKAYDYNFCPIVASQDVLGSTGLLPPIRHQPIGRPKKRRIENMHCSRKVRKIIKCSACGKTGHNKATCLFRE
jgi:SWIM zinc finger